MEKINENIDVDYDKIVENQQGGEEEEDEQEQERTSLDNSPKLHEMEYYSKNKSLTSRKPWYSAFTFSYKQRNEDFKRLFKDLPNEERLLVDYACALQKEILAQGRLYISINYVCFYANIFGWETVLTIKLKDIKSLQKDKTVMVIPNAITLVLSENEKHFFTSFSSRDKTYTTLYKLWQISKLEQSMDTDEVNLLVKSFYGEDLGYNSNDEEYEYYCKSTTTTTKKVINNNSLEQLFDTTTTTSMNESKAANFQIGCESSSDSNNKNSFEVKYRYDRGSSSRSESPENDDLKNRNKKQTTRRKTLNHSKSSSSSEIEEPFECDCSEHVGKEMLNKAFNLSVENLFESMFGHTEFCSKFWESRKFFDMKIGEWKSIENYRTRRLEYSVLLNSPIAVKGCNNVEDQKLLKYIPHKCIIMESSSISQGVPYSDCFSVICRYCFTKIDKNRSNFKVHAYINYSQKPVFFVKAFIEKNAMGALQDAYQYIAQNLIPDFSINGIKCHEIKNTDKKLGELKESSNGENIEISAIKSVNNTILATSCVDGEKKTIKIKKIKQNKRRSSVQIDSTTTMSTTTTTKHLVPIQTFTFLKWNINVDTLVRLFIIAMVCLMIINGMLYLKLRRIELLADGLKNDPQIISRYYQVLSESNSNDGDDAAIKDDWKNILMNTLKNIEKMGYSLNEWNLSNNKNKNNDL